MKLIEAFRINRGDVVALVGAGGKTSLLYAMGKEAAALGWKAVLTTTTKIYLPGAGDSAAVVLGNSPELEDSVGDTLRTFPLVVAGAGTAPGGKMLGVDAQTPGRFLDAGADIVIVEADGAAGKPFKAPRDGEPVIPDTATLVAPVVGIDCLGRPLAAEYVHRPDRVLDIAGDYPGGYVSAETVSRVLLSSRGYRGGIPPGSRWAPFINKVESGHDLIKARDLAMRLGRGGAALVVIGAALSPDPVIEVIEF